MSHPFWQDKTVFLTGHTGFKGGWLALWLKKMGANVHGYALEPSANQSFYKATDLENVIEQSIFANILDAERLADEMQNAEPDIVFHLAAQSLVRQSYVEPVKTYATNVMGTVNCFEAVRKTKSVKVIVNVTTDKCYENREWIWPYREDEPMGGFDPYSSSKACSELVTSAYRRSFFANENIALASARAGNVIGGGDWAEDRLIPDCFRAIDKGEILTIRAPKATRPWQHVCEPLNGYLTLAERLYEDSGDFAEAWNFGPNEDDAKPVEWILDYMSKKITDLRWQLDTKIQPHEANMLKLDISKAKAK